MEYIKAKQYLIKPSIKGEICVTIRDNFDSRTAARLIRYITTDKPLTFSRWLKYFDYNLLEDILVEVVDNEDLGI